MSADGIPMLEEREEGDQLQPKEEQDLVSVPTWRGNGFIAVAVVFVAAVALATAIFSKIRPQPRVALAEVEEKFLTTHKVKEVAGAVVVNRKCSTMAGVQVASAGDADDIWLPCSVKWTEDCSQTGCCSDWGLKCYRRDKYWATCKATCEPRDKDNKTWSCEEVSPPKPRTAEGCTAQCRERVDCQQAVFAGDAGGRCHLSKERHTSVVWASDTANSSFCGEAPQEAEVKRLVEKVQKQLPFVAVLPMVNCSWGGKDCSQTKCCNNYLCDADFKSCNGFSCWQKDEYFSGCAESPLEGWNGTWLGGAREHRNIPPAGEQVAVHGNSLYCFTVVTWDAPRPKPFWNSEAEIANNWKEKGLHVLQCDGSDILDGLKTEVAEWGSFSNIDMFMQIWQNVKGLGKWKQFDWTVKVDSDAVFFADRLKQHLWGLRTPQGARVYVENIDFKFKYMGAIEIMTREAAEVFLEKGHTCINGKHEGGEDSFLKTCLDGLGIDHQSDYSILHDKYAGLNPPCTDGWTVVFHYMKKMHDWAKCYNEALCGTGKPKNCDLAIKVPDEIPLKFIDPAKAALQEAAGGAV